MSLNSVTNESILEMFIESVGNLIDKVNSDTWQSEKESTRAVQLLSAVDTITEKLSDNLTPGEQRNFTNSNIALLAQTVTGSVFVYPDENVDVDWLKTTRSEIKWQLQSSADVAESFIATAVVYRNLNGILPNTYSKSTGSGIADGSESTDENTINGPVLAMTIPSQQSEVLESSISITVEHHYSGLSAPLCVFWQYTSESQGLWSDDGCALVTTSNDVTVCECSHLTNFAVLMSPIKQKDQSAWDLRIISIVCLSLSILCLVATIVVHVTFWK
ncbi:adhesion G protein-coupled receptor L4-like [Ruditapes philippinarum]|uniref:adhesion G protein-coupled receptor L4-like n=1 Tax=Ruditapes philippinarum TaxID=129788 RepID=UPI00295C0869|nr:adhesion G protein-coupled receptor L4-like [Ruditapes philippinarum]